MDNGAKKAELSAWEIIKHSRPRRSVAIAFSEGRLRQQYSEPLIANLGNPQMPANYLKLTAWLMEVSTCLTREQIRRNTTAASHSRYFRRLGIGNRRHIHRKENISLRTVSRKNRAAANAQKRMVDARVASQSAQHSAS